MSHRREIVHSLTSLVGVTVALGVFVGLAGLVVGTAFLELGEREVPVEPAATLAHPVENSGTTHEVATADVIQRGPAVHLQMPAMVPRVGSRQVRVTLSLQGAVADEEVGHEFVEVSFTTDDPRIYVVPPSALLAREELRHAAFFVAARPDLPCGEVPIGQLRVSVRGLAPAAESLVGQAPLPHLDCDSEPPVAPDSVNVTDPVCGPEHADQAQRLLDGESLHPRICDAERWHDGRWREPRVAPAPAPAPRGRPDPEPEAADDDATVPPDDSATDEENEDVPEPKPDEGDGGDTGGDDSSGSDTGGDDAGSNSGSRDSGPEAQTSGDTDGDTSGEATG